MVRGDHGEPEGPPRGQEGPSPVNAISVRCSTILPQARAALTPCEHPGQVPPAPLPPSLPWGTCWPAAVRAGMPSALLLPELTLESSHGEGWGKSPHVSDNCLTRTLLQKPDISFHPETDVTWATRGPHPHHLQGPVPEGHLPRACPGWRDLSHCSRPGPEARGHPETWKQL